jgi:hypothetical protein
MQQHRDSALQSHDISFRKIGDQLTDLAQRCTAHEKSERILESLYCEEVHKRELGVSDAVDYTFDWAFNAWCSGNRLDCGCRCTGSIDATSDYRCPNHEGSPQRPCNGLASHQKHLLSWLENKTSEPFVVTGKPGSGKSTFMKFIASHETTRQALANWAGDRKLLVTRFYFWSSGSPLQRSQEGLLQCLLYQILSQAPEIISTAVSRRWQNAGHTPRITEPWTRREILDAFSSIVNANPLRVNICFFIDGLDEYGGSDLANGDSDLELVSQLKKLASSPHIKLCLSSRPRNVVQNHLISDESRHITLHNHTAKDIEQFVQSRIASVQQLIDIDPCDLEELRELIVERSSGVFLWVVLVVRELLDGLEPPFSLPEMIERLLLLPETLEEYFHRTLNKVHQQHRRFTARLLLMTVHGFDLDLDIAYSLSLLDRERSHSHHTLSSQQQKPQVPSQSWRRDICLRIRKSCGDFLDAFDDDIRCYVSLTHRSVKDFLEIPEVKSQLLRYADWQEDDIPLAFCKAFVSSCEQGISSRVGNWGAMISRFMRYAAQYELQSGKSCSVLMYKLDSVLCSRRLLDSRDNGSSHWIRAVFGPCHSDVEIPEANALLFCATIHRVHIFAEQEIESSTPQDAVMTLNALLHAVILSCYDVDLKTGFFGWCDAIRFLCKKGADPNDVVRTTVSRTADRKTTLTWTIWEIFLDNDLLKCENVNHSRWISPLPLRKTFPVMKQLIESGADLNCKVPVGCKSVQQAIEKRLEADCHARTRYGDDIVQRKQWMNRIKAALLKRGYVWVEADGET